MPGRKRSHRQSTVLPVSGTAPDGDDPQTSAPIRRSHYKFTTKASQRPGDETAIFPMTTPTGAGVSTSKTFWATPLGLSARTSVDKVHYSLEMTLAFKDGGQAATMEFQNMFAADSDLTGVTKKFSNFRLKLRARYPNMVALPQVKKVDEPPYSIAYQMELPPYTCFFTDNPHLWAALRFNKEDVTAVQFGPASDARQKYGFINRTHQTAVFSGRGLQDPYDTPIDMFRSAVGGENVAPPAKVRVEVEFFTDWLPQTLAEEKPLDRDTAAQALVRLLKTGLLLLNLDSKTIEVDAQTPGRVVLKSKQQTLDKAVRVDLSIRLSSPLKDFFLIDNPLITFPGTDARTVALVQREPTAQDPLAGRYPIHLVALGQSEAHHHLNGYGWVSMLGLLSAPNKFIGKAEWVQLRPGQSEIRLMLIDRWCQPVTANAPIELVLYLELVDLF